jgi:hypothetical protein
MPRADEPDVLMARIAEVLGGQSGVSSLTRTIGRDVFVEAEAASQPAR